MQSITEFSGIVVIVGNYGCGKTEVAINLAIDQQHKGLKVRLADLDLVNPYFRTREARKTLTAFGVEVLLPPEGMLQADLPILVPQVAGAIRQSGDLTILDVGGEDVGATVLAALADAFQGRKQGVQTLQVVNPHRPTTDTPERCLAMRAAIESASGLNVNGWIGNANLIDETTVDHLKQGYDFMERLAVLSGLPLVFTTVAQELFDRMDDADVRGPVLTIRRQLVPPWKKPFGLSFKRPCK